MRGCFAWPRSRSPPHGCSIGCSGCGRSANPLTALEVPIAIGTMALAMALLGQNPVMGVIAVASGAMVGVMMWTAPAAASRVRSTVRSLASNEVAFLVAVFIAALALRLLYVQRIMADPNYLDTGADGRIYDQLAWSIASGDGIPESFTNRFPLLLLGYVWFLAVIYKIVGHSYFAAVAVQSILGAATVLLIYVAGKYVFGAAVGRVAALFTALSFSLIFAAAALGHQAVDLFLTALIVVVLLWLSARDGHLTSLGTGGAWRWGVAGLAIGLAFAVRETNIFLVLFVLPWVALANSKGWRASGPAVAALAAGIAIVVLPFLAPKMWTPGDRQAMWGHFDRMYRGEGEAPSLPRPDLASPLTDPAAALSQLREDPVGLIATLSRAYAINFGAQFFTQPYGGFDLVFLRKGSEYYYGMWFYAYALTVAGTVVAIRMVLSHGVRASGVVLILGVIAFRTLPHLILVSNYRHRVPIEPFLILLASVGAVTAWRAVSATAANTITSGFTGSDWRVSQSSGT